MHGNLNIFNNRSRAADKVRCSRFVVESGKG
jgi:hypothetical protein